MKHDAFSQYHPLVNFIFFLFAIGFGVVFQHPAYLLAGCLGSGVYYLLLTGKKGIKTVAFLLIAFVAISLMNPLFNTQGETVLFFLFGRPYTLQALYFGCAVAAIFVIMMLWFGCYNAVMTSDKFCSLFGSVIPSLSLLLVMVLRLVPGLLRKARQIANCRSSIGKGVDSSADRKQKLSGGMTVLSALTSWALEGSMVTADSMRSRGYGCSRRSSFQIYRFRLRDILLICFLAVLSATVILSAATGAAQAAYTPHCEFAPVTGVHLWGMVCYCVFLLIPTMLHVKEVFLWHIFKSRI